MDRTNDSPPTPPLGPVDTLEKYVSPEWWRDLFDETYLLTDGDVLSQSITEEEVDRFVEEASLRPTDHILDLCCGQGRHSLELARREFRHVQGIDQSEYLIDVAREMAQSEEVDVSFDVGDARTLPYDSNAFDVVLLLGNSFGYFDDVSEDRTVLQEIRRVLRSEGRVLFDLTDGDCTRAHLDPHSWEWASDRHVVCRERELADDGQRLVARELVLSTEQGLETDQFYSERLYGRRDVSALLRPLGFHDLEFSGLKGNSERGQDLGMMGHRFLLTARTPTTEGTAASATGEAVDASGGRRSGTDDHGPPRYVAVVLGDPSRADETKRGGVFDEDDYEVLDRLRDALHALPGYDFIYFDDHDTLLEDLRTYGDAVDLVLNLCDEGLRNRPQQELHVPALLETLEIPYTGAGPQCLAHCYDKSMIRGVATEMGIPVAKGYFLRLEADLPELSTFSYPVIVKPNAADNSAGMTTGCIAEGPEELNDAVASVRQHVGHDRALLVEEFLRGADLTYGVVGNPSTGYRSLPISEDNYSRLPANLPPFCGYEAKWIPDSPYWTDVEAVPASLPERIQKQIQADSQTLFERLGCRDYARFDWRLDQDGNPHLLEVNPNPGWSWDSHLVEAAAFAGDSYSEVLAAILDTAYRRCGIEAQSVNSPR